MATSVLGVESILIVPGYPIRCRNPSKCPRAPFLFGDEFRRDSVDKSPIHGSQSPLKATLLLEVFLAPCPYGSKSQDRGTFLNELSNPFSPVNTNIEMTKRTQFAGPTTARFDQSQTAQRLFQSTHISIKLQSISWMSLGSFDELNPIHEQSRNHDCRLKASTFLGLIFILASTIGCDQRNKFVPSPPPEVTVQNPSRRTVDTFLEYSGVLQAFNTVELRARVKGFLKERTFKAGDEVEANQLLLLIDETSFLAQVKQSEAKLAEAQAVLEKAKTSKSVEIATAGLALDNAVDLLAKIELSRQKSLVARNAASQQNVDVADANLKKVNAQVESDEATLAQAKTDFQVNILAAEAGVASAAAQVAQAKIDLAYCRILAPTAGVISRSYVDPGNLVGDGSATLLATLFQEDQIYAYISISEADVLRFRKMRDAGERADYRNVKIPLDLGMMNEKGFPHRGYVEYADPGVDPTTGTVQARGIFSNPKDQEKGRKLLPGAFVRVRVPFETKSDAILVPELAVNSDPQGKFVLVVNAENKVERKSVVVGSELDGERIVESGLSPKDRVVVSGMQRARPGLVVKPVESKPAAESTSSTKKS